MNLIYTSNGWGFIRMSRKRKVEKDYHALAKSRGFKWVGGVLPKNTLDSTWWECEKGDKWETSYNNIQQGSGCPVCSGKARKKEKDYHELAKSRGFKWVGEVLPKNNQDPTWWECEKGDRWEARYHDIQQGNGCPVCSGKVRKTGANYHELAKSRGFKWAGEVLPKNNQDPTWWECEEGHRWKACYNNVRQGSGCSTCSGKARKIEEDYHDLAKNRGFKWIGRILPKNIKDPTWWECEKGHRWETTYSSIQQGSGCPVCKDMVNGFLVSKPQRKLNRLLCGGLNYQEGRYSVDIVIMRKSQKIAVEYDCCYWHKGNEEYDAKRDNCLISCGWKVLHIKSRTLLPTRKQLNMAIVYLLETNNVLYNLYLEDWKS